MSNGTERIYNLEQEDDVQNAVIMSDKTGRPKAKHTHLNLFALRTEAIIQEITDENFKDFNHSGWQTLQGCRLLTALGSELENVPFTPVLAYTYLITAQVSNITDKIHKIDYYIKSSGTDFGGKIKHFARMGVDFNEAITAGFTEYTISPFNYVSGIQQFQVIDNLDYVNATNDYMQTALIQEVDQLNANSVLRFDFNGYVIGQQNGTGVQFRLMQSDNFLDETIVFPVGTTKRALNYNFYLPLRFPVNPSTFRVDFKNINGSVSLLGTEKGSTMYITETYQTVR